MSTTEGTDSKLNIWRTLEILVPLVRESIFRTKKSRSKKVSFSYAECSENHECEGIEVCGIDGVCRNPCNTAGTCNIHGIADYYLEGEGDCDSDAECKGDLVCGKHSCIIIDCCRKRKGLEGEPCRSKEECGGRLVCGIDGLCRNPCQGDASCCTNGIDGYCLEDEGRFV